ncbi:Transposon protein [Zea mays]|uniref:RING-type E3 ubiquitin transferase n=1 Tax=Zea mays TaxID=4577 RepID=A0A1D6P965_MAIZE|nr:Transposon protein [Zea mays]
MPSRSGSRGRRPRPAPEVAAPTAVQVSSSGSSEEGSDEEEEGSEGSGDGARSPGGSASKYKAAESEAEAEDPCLPSCPICMVVWTADGAHRVSCIPCGHVYGRHCLEMWLLQYGKKKAPCPQCGKRYTQNNIINLYVPEIVVPNNDLENQVLSLRERNEYLEKQQAKLLEEIKEHKVSMFHGHGMEKIHLPPGTKAIRDICVLPGGHVVFASLGRKLSIFSVATNNVVLQYDLPAPGWSCSGDYTTSSHIYAGLQNGMLLVFDIRQTSAPLHSSMGLSTHPVHTIHCAVDGSGSRKVFSASSIGPCVWDASENRPSLVSGMENQGVCISLACSSPSSDVLVASYRPRVELPDAIATSQASTPQSPAPTGSGKLGCHTLRDNQHLFAYGDESLYGVRTWRLPSFQRYTDLKPHRQPVLDLRYAESSTGESSFAV